MIDNEGVYKPVIPKWVANILKTEKSTTIFTILSNAVGKLEKNGMIGRIGIHAN